MGDSRQHLRQQRFIGGLNYEENHVQRQIRFDESCIGWKKDSDETHYKSTTDVQ